MPNIVIGNTVIRFPASGSDANWAPPIIQFAEAVQDALLTIVTPFGVSPKVQILTTDLITNLNISQAIFPNNNVRSFTLSYSIYRTNAVITQTADGILSGQYNSLSMVWIIENNYVGSVNIDGTPFFSLDMSGDQVIISIDAMGGAYNDIASKISYSASTELVSNI